MSAIAEPPPSAGSALPTGRMPAAPSGETAITPATPPTASRKSFSDRLAKSASPAAEPPPPAWEREPVDDDRPGTEEKPNTEGGEPEKTENGNVPRGTNKSKPEVDPKNGQSKKVNNWKALNDSVKLERGRVAELTAKLQQIESQRMPEQERLSVESRAVKAEARVKELEDHIRYVDYSKSSEFKEKFDDPYTRAWNRATAELAEIPITDATTQQVRAATAEDLMALVNLPLGQARQLANEAFGDFADDVMAHRKEVRTLFDQREAALKEAKDKGGERQQQQIAAQRDAAKKSATEIGGYWAEINKAILDHPSDNEFLKAFVIPEGKQATPEEKEWNDFLAKGQKLVEDGWKLNPLDPKLTPEQRKEAVAMHAAIRLRAAAFGPLKRLAKRLQKRVTELEGKLAGYNGSTPTVGGGKSSALGPVTNARNSFHNRLAKMVSK